MKSRCTLVNRAAKPAGRISPFWNKPIILGFLIVSAAPLTASAQGGPPPGIRQDRVLVKPIRGVDLSVLHSKVGTRVLPKFPAIGNLQVVQVPQGVKVGNLLTTFRQSGLVQYAEPDFRAQALVTPN